MNKANALPGVIDVAGKRTMTPLLWLTFGLCWATMLLDGYDLLVFGAIIPELIREPGWNVTAGSAGAIASYALVGMLIGTTAVGTLTDLIGRRKVIIACQTAFSLLMLAATFSPSPELLGLFRFLAGICLGGVLPTVISLTLEYATPKKKSLIYGIMYSGYSVGGISAAVLAIYLIPAFGWRACLLAGALPVVLIVPLSLAFLPESIAFLQSKGRTGEAEQVAARLGIAVPDRPASQRATREISAGREGRFSSLALLFTKKYIRITLLLWTTTFMGLLLTYGLGTWIPSIMRSSGYALGPSLIVGAALNVGAIIGTIGGGFFGDKIGLRKVLFVSFGCAVIANIVLSMGPSLVINMIAVGVAGFGSIGTALLINAFVASYYPTTSQATAVGWALGVGRIGGILGPVAGGAIAGAQLPVSWNFYFFGLVAIVGAMTLLFVPSAKPTSDTPSAKTPMTATRKMVM